MTKPPQTVRYCINCEKNRNFKYNHIIGHSECTECGFRFAEPRRKNEVKCGACKYRLNAWCNFHRRKTTKKDTCNEAEEREWNKKEE